MNIAQLKQDVANGVMIGRETWKQLVEWAYERRHVEPNEANFHRLIAKCGLSKKQEGYVMGAYRQSFVEAPRENLPGTGPHKSIGIKLDPAYIAVDIDRVGIGQPSMPAPKDAIEIAVERTNVFNRAVEKLAESIYTAWPESDKHPWQAWGNSIKQDEARAMAHKLLTDKTRPAVECGDSACPRCTTGAPGFCINADAHMQAAPADAGHPIDAAAFAAPRPATQAPAWHNPASAIANISRFTEHADCCQNEGVASMLPDQNGEYVRYVDVCKAFGVEP